MVILLGYNFSVTVASTDATLGIASSTGFASAKCSSPAWYFPMQTLPRHVLAEFWLLNKYMVTRIAAETLVNTSLENGKGAVSWN